MASLPETSPSPDVEIAGPRTSIATETGISAYSPPPEAPRVAAARRLELGPISTVAAVCLCGVFAFIDLYATQPLL